MRVTVVSDVHSNLAALDSVLRHARDQRALDAVWSLGDLVGYGPQPNEVIARLAEHSALSVSGNHDLAASGRIDTADFNGDAAIACAWNAAELNEDSSGYLGALPEIASPSNATCVLCHGSLRDPTWEYMVTEDAAQAQFALMEVPWSFVGHTHIPLAIEMTKDGNLHARRPDSGDKIPLMGRRLILNPGGVGQPRDGDPRACYAILDTDTQTVEFWRVPYPVEKTQNLMSQAGLPIRLIQRLAVGR
jgi:predicted phosphodiesterase